LPAEFTPRLKLVQDGRRSRQRHQGLSLLCDSLTRRYLLLHSGCAGCRPSSLLFRIPCETGVTTWDGPRWSIARNQCEYIARRIFPTFGLIRGALDDAIHRAPGDLEQCRDFGDRVVSRSCLPPCRSSTDDKSGPGTTLTLRTDSPRSSKRWRS
jgi:hypothetical protein